MEKIVVFRYVNIFYYLLFLIYMILFLIYIIPRRKNQPYKNALTIFIITSIVLISMEFFGTFVGIRVFYIGGEINVGYQLLLQIIMGVGEGGTVTAIIYLMIDSIYEKELKKYLFYMISLTILMLMFATLTFFHKTL
ncbi:MAG: hypothetical protein ACTSQJ_01910 [Promethearchaeota archaeon]